jgi:hypothetical protein
VRRYMAQSGPQFDQLIQLNNVSFVVVTVVASRRGLSRKCWRANDRFESKAVVSSNNLFTTALEKSRHSALMRTGQLHPLALSALPKCHGQTWSTVSDPEGSTCPNFQHTPSPVIPLSQLSNRRLSMQKITYLGAIP